MLLDPLADDDEGFDLPDPPYVGGDHAAQCRGCDHCAELEERYFAERDRLARLSPGGSEETNDG